MSKRTYSAYPSTNFFLVLSSKSMALVAKLTALLIVALCDPENCLFHSSSISSRTVTLIRQIILICALGGFVVLQTIVGPFIDPVSNASEWVSRASYLVTALLGLGKVFGGTAESVLEGPILDMFVLPFSTAHCAIRSSAADQLPLPYLTQCLCHHVWIEHL